MSEVARWAGVAVLIIVGGFIGLIALFSDAPSKWISIAEIVVIFFGAGLLIGLLHPLRWWVAGFAAWPGFLLLGAGFLSDPRFRDAPVLTVFVGDGYIQTSLDSIYASHIKLQIRNEGRQTHELAIFQVKDREIIDQLRAEGRVETLGQPFSFRPLRAGQEDVANLVRGVLAPGANVIACLRETAAGVPHITLGELALIHVDPEP